MTTETIVPRTPYPYTAIPGELLDALVEAVVLPADPRARSAVIWRLVQEMWGTGAGWAAIGRLVREMCDTVEWRHGRDKKFGRATDAELASIRRLASAARD